MERHAGKVWVVAAGLLLIATPATVVWAGSWPSAFLVALSEVKNPNPIRPLIVVRFPMLVEPAVEDAFVRDYTDKYVALGWNTASYPNPATVEAAANLMLVKSAYHGFELATCMRR